MPNFIIARTADDEQVRVPATDVTSFATGVQRERRLDNTADVRAKVEPPRGMKM